MTESDNPLLREHLLFKNLSSTEWEYVRSCIREKSFAKGEFLYECGDDCQRIIIIKTGNVKVFRPNSSGREQTLQILMPGDTCACNPGEPSWKCSACAAAMTDCDVWYLSRMDYIYLVNRYSKLSGALNHVLAQRLKRMNSLVEEVSLENSRKRLVKFLLGLFDAPECECRCGQKDCLEVPYNYEEIARRLGVVRETMTRHLNQLKRHRLIDIQPRRIIILNRKALEEMLA